MGSLIRGHTDVPEHRAAERPLPQTAQHTGLRADISHFIPSTSSRYFLGSFTGLENTVFKGVLQRKGPSIP